MPRSSGLDDPELQTLLLQIVDATRELPRHGQEWNLYAGLLRAPGVELQVLDHDVLTLADMGFLHTTNLNYVYGNDYIVTKLGYEHAEIIREGQVESLSRRLNALSPPLFNSFTHVLSSSKSERKES